MTCFLSVSWKIHAFSSSSENTPVLIDCRPITHGTDLSLPSFRQHFHSFGFSFTPTYHLTSVFPASHRAAECSFILLCSPPTSHPNMSLPPLLTSLLITSLHGITRITTTKPHRILLIMLYEATLPVMEVFQSLRFKFAVIIMWPWARNCKLPKWMY